MSNMQRWNPFDEMQRLQEQFQRLLGVTPFGTTGTAPVTQSWGPSVDLRETETAFHISADIPGVDPKDCEVVVGEDSLIIRGEVKSQTGKMESGYQHLERRYGTFHRTIPLPVSVQHEQAQADYRNGVLEITVPKSQNAPTRATRVQIHTDGNPQLPQ